MKITIDSLSKINALHKTLAKKMIFGSAWMLSMLLWLGSAVLSCAAPIINNNAGTWTDLYNDNLGVSSLQQTVVDSASGVVKLISGQTTGDFTTVRVKPTSFDAWGTLVLDGTWASSANVTVTLLDSADTPITGFTAMPYTSAINLSSLSPTTYPEIKVKVGLNAGTLSPVITSLRVSWNPISLLLLDKKAPISVQAGQVITYRVRYSTSYVEARDLVVWDRLPNTAQSTITYPASHGQNDNVTFVSATAGGVYTASAITVKGVSIPANSVYWDLGTKKEGTTETLTFAVKTRNGTLNGTTVSNQAFADAANASAVSSAAAVTTITSLPAPVIKKSAGSGIYFVSNENLTQPNSENCFSIQAENTFTGEGRETMYETVVYDRLTDLVGKIDPDYGAVGVPVKNITGGGTYVANYTPPSGGASFPAVVWTVGTMEPGAIFSASFCVKLLDTPPLASTGQYTNTAIVDSARTRAPVRSMTPLSKDLLVKWPLDETPTGSFAKGDNLRGAFQINALRDDDKLLFDNSPWSSTNPYLYTKPGGVVPYGLLVRNNGLSAMNELVFLDKVPVGTTFKSAWFTDPWFQANARIFYSTTNTADANTPPTYDYTAAPTDLDASGNSFWENYATNPPSNLADVRWVAFYIPAVNSQFFDSSSPGWVPGAPQGGVAYYDVTVSPTFLDPDPCADKFVNNRALFRAHRYTPLNGGTPLASTLAATDDEPTRVSTDKAILAVDGRGAVSVPVITNQGNLTYTVRVKNVGEAIAGGVQVEIIWPQVEVNGVTQYLPFVSTTPASIATFDPAHGRVVLNLGNLAPGAVTTVSMTVFVPKGVSYGEQLTFNSTISAAPTACPIANVTDQASAVSDMLPLLRMVKDDVLDLIPSGAELDYALTLYNEGDSPSHNTYIIDRVPAEMIFVQAYGRQGEQVLFSADDHLPPAYLTPTQPVNAATIAAKFTPGILNDNGTPADPTDDTWTSPFGDQTRWVAWQMDDTTLTPPAYRTGTANSVGFRVKNDADGPGSGTAGSAVGTVIFNSGATFSEELLQAIGNEVVTTINDSPAILVQKTGPSSINTGVSFTWNIAYYNNSGTSDDVVTIVDTLPAGVTLLSATHTWNATALANGAPVGNNGQAVPTSAVSNPDGTTTVTFEIAGATGYRGNGNDLAPGEGGTIQILAQVNAGITSGTPLLNRVTGTATNGSDSSSSSDQHLVMVRNAELLLSKTSSISNPVAGDEVTYNLIISNLSTIQAEGVVITDTLSPDMTFVTGSTLVLTPGYVAGAPNISSGTLTWSTAYGNAITRSPLAAGILPASSGNVVIQYRATVNAGTPAGTALPNTATVTTTTPEDGTHPNTDTETIHTPHPDPTILKSGLAFTSPGDRFAWDIRYWNNLRQSASNVYLIDTLPDYNADGEADVTYISHSAPAGVTAYYHAGSSGTPPVFNPLAPVSGGWSAVPTSPVNHLAFLVGTLAGEAGPFTITVTTDAIAPNGGSPALLPAGVTLRNQASIHTTDTDQNPANNTDDHITRTPGNDISLTKSASVEGSTPGIAPGKSLTYTLQVQNSGTQTAYGVEVLDTLPSGVTLGSPEDNFLELALDDGGTTVAPLDALGNPISGPVPVTRVVNGSTVRWYLGTINPSDDLYFRKVGLPSGSGQSFEVYVTINANVTDSTTLVNSATAYLRNQSDTDPAEEVTSNNTDDSRVTVFLPDLTVLKSVKNVSDNSEQWTESGRTLEYTLEYDNAGNMDAQNVTLSEIIPTGTTFVPGSIVGAEDAGNVQLQDFDNDGRVDAFDIYWASLPAPAFFFGEDLKCYGLSAAAAVKISSTSGAFGGALPNLGRFGNDVAVIGDVDGDGVTDLAVGNYQYTGTLTTGAVWIVFRNADGTVKGQSLITDGVGGLPASTLGASHQFGSGVTGLGDFDGDGTPDIAVGSAGYNAEGAVYVLFLKPDGTADRFERISNNSGGINATFIDASDFFGTSLELVGDVNKDGTPDLVVGAPGYDATAGGNEGIAYILFMNTDHSGKATSYEKIYKDNMGVTMLANDAFGTSVTALGDLNADGVPDVAVGAVRDTTRGSGVYLVSLTIAGTPQQSVLIDGLSSVFEGKVARASRFGIGLAGGVDFNSDGIADLVVGAYGDDGAPTGTRPFAGAAYILFLNRNSTVQGMNKFSAATQTLLSGLDASDNFGFGLAAASDLSGDGVPDIIGGAPQDDDGGSNRGAIWQLNLQTGSLPCTLNGTHVQAGHLYEPPANAEALDTPTKLAATHPALAALLEDNEEFGSAVSGIGDINSDGYPDIAIGSWKRSVSAVQVGAVYIVRMGAGRSVLGVNRITTGESGFSSTLLANDRFGCAVAGLGDISGDGTHAIAVGAYNDDDGGANSNRGAVWILFLNADGTVNRTQKISSTAGSFSGPLVNSDNFGWALAAVPDMDGDSVPELLSSSYGDDTGGTDRGAVYLLRLNTNGTIKSHEKIAHGVGGFPTGQIDNGDRLGSGVATLGDMNGDGVTDFVFGAEQDDDGASNRGAVYVCFMTAGGTVSSIQKISSTIGSFTGVLDSSDFFGGAVAAAGDVNGDGVPDLVVGAKNDDDVPEGGTGSNRGAIWLLTLNASGTVEAWRKTSAATSTMATELAVGDLYGQAVGSLGDLDGDGFNDIGTGASLHDAGGTNRGAVWIASLTPVGHYLTGTYEKLVSSDCLVGWRDLIVDQTVPDGTAIEWSILTPDGSQVLFGPNNMESGLLSVSGISATYKDVLVRAVLTSENRQLTPQIHGWKLTYYACEKKQIKFRVTVDDPVPASQLAVNNTVAISTSTPEIRQDNNSATDSILIRLTDVEVTKLASVASARPGDPVAFTLDWVVNGPQLALGLNIEDTLPAGFTFVSATPAPSSVSGQVLTWNLGDQAVNASGSITVQTTVAAGTPADTYTNVVRASNERQETNTTNNEDSVPVVVVGLGDPLFANVLISKTGPATAQLGGLVTYTLNYLSNGGGDAANVIVTDVLPADLTFVSAVPAPTSTVGQTVTWNLGTVANGTGGSITLTAQAGSDYLTLHNTVLVNPATIATTTGEVTLADNYDEHPVTLLGAPAAISGYVWFDRDHDGIKDPTETGIPDTLLTLTGTDVYGQPVLLTQSTDLNGYYAFTGLVPGIYQVVETQPAGYRSTADLLGTVAGSANGTNSNPLDDQLTAVSLGADARGIEYNFGETITVNLGNSVWQDTDRDGTQDAGETGLTGATVALFQADGTTPATDADGAPVTAQVTGADGLYNFTNLLAGDYVVRVTPPAGYDPTISGGDPDNDNATDSNGEPVTGQSYVQSQPVTLSPGTEPGADGDSVDGNLTVDFGFIQPTDFGDLPDTSASTGAGNYQTTLANSGPSHVLVAGLNLGTTNDSEADGLPNSTATGDGAEDDGVSAFLAFLAGSSGSLTVSVTNTTGTAATLYGFMDWNGDGDFGDANETTSVTVPNAATSVNVPYTVPAGALTATDIGLRLRLTTNTLTLDNAGSLGAATDGEVEDYLIQATAPATIGNLVWNDADNDGAFDAGETPAEGVIVELLDGSGNPIDSDSGTAGVQPTTDTTDVDGLYTFTNLAPASYQVRIATPPAGLTLSSTVTDTADNQQDNDDNGTQATLGGATLSPVITLAAGETDNTIDFGFLAPATISGSVLADTDNDNDGDTGIQTVTVKLFSDPNGDGDPADGSEVSSTTTAADGSYSFTDLVPGTYVVVETQPSGYLTVTDLDSTTPGDDVANSSTTDNLIPVTVIAGETDSGNDFIEEQTAALGNFVWNDADNDGAFDAGETALQGVVVELLDGSGNPIDSDSGTAGVQPTTDTTDVDGLYTFTNLAPGSYQVRIATPPAGLTFSSTVTDTADNQQDNDDNGTQATIGGATLSSVIALAAGETDNTIDFGFLAPATISGSVLADTDNDNDGDTGIQTVTVKLFSDPNGDGDPADGSEVGSTTTAADGSYSFTDLVPGTYVVVETQPSGYLTVTDLDSTTPGDDVANSSTTDNLIPVTVIAGETDSGNDFIEEQPAALGNFVWNDADNDGAFDVGETALQGVVVELLDGSGNPIDSDSGTAGVQPTTDTTDVDGLYTFTNLAPASYQVRIATPPTGLTLSSTVTDTADNQQDNDDNGTQATIGGATLSPVIALAAGETDNTIDFGFLAPATISGSVLADTDNDNDGDTGIQTVTVKLFSDPNGDGDPADGSEVSSTTTAADGSYSFTDLVPGTYVVVETQPSGYLTVTDLDSTTPGDDVANSSTTDNLIPVTVIAGETDSGNDFIEEQTAALGNFVWNDADNDGAFDVGETALQGVVVELLDGSGNPIDSDSGTAGVQPTTDTTDVDGLYTFTNLAPGSYQVRIATPPTGLTLSSTVTDTADNQQDNDDNGTQATIGGATLSPVIALAAGETDNTIDFGFLAPATISGSVLADTDNDDDGDAPITPVTVKLFSDPNGDGDPADGSEVGSTTTAADGSYSFTDLVPGTYVVVETQPAGYLTVTDLDSTTPGDDVANSSTTDNLIPVTVTAGETDTGNDFIEEQPAALGNFVWNDADNDGAFDVGETALQGVVVELLDGSGNPIDSDSGTAGVQPTTDTTDVDGLYTFTNLAPASYQVRIATPPAGLTLSSTATDTADNQQDNDDNGTQATIGGATLSPVIALAAGETDNTIDFGFLAPATISGSVLADTDNDNDGDTGIQTVTVKLFSDPNGDGDPADGSEVGSTTTAADGSYSFTDLVPGTYVVVETQPSGYLTVTDLDSTTPGDDVANSSTTDNLIPVTVTSGETDNGNDFIEEQTATIGNFVWNDADNDGLFDAGETPAAGVVVELLDGSGNPIDSDSGTAGVQPTTDTTDIDGLYTFTNLAPASYQVRIATPPAGLTLSSTVTDTADNQQDNDDNGTQATLGGATLSPVITLAAGETDNTIDFGFLAPATISGSVLADTDNDNDGDTGIQTVTVKLFSDPNGDGDPADGSEVGSTTTAADGSYSFPDLVPGDYVVVQTQPSGYLTVTDLDSTTPGDDVANSSTSDNALPVTVTSGETDNGNDFIEEAITYAVGNLVFVDANGNGVADSGEGVNGVTIVLKDSLGDDIDSDSGTADVQPTTTTTAGGGFYLFSGLPAGSYIVAIPAAEFQTGGDLVGRLSLPGNGIDNGTDDLNDENGVDSASPWTFGITTPLIALGGTEPTATETGLGGTSDDGANDATTDLTVDFGFIGGKATSFGGWQQQNPLGGQNGPTDDPDGDGIPNLAEFAFCYDAQSGIGHGCPLELEVQADGSVNAVVRELVTASGLTYTLQSLTDLSLSPGGWANVTSLTPTFTSNGDGTQDATYTGVDSLPVFGTSGQGFFRVKVTDTVSSTTVYTSVEGFTKRAFDNGCRTCSDPYLNCPRATGTVGSIAGSTLDCTASVGTGSLAAALASGQQHYIEITSGDNEGQRYEINEAATTATALAIDTASALNTQATLPASLAGDTWELRTHQRISDLYPPTKFTATGSPSTADRILYPNGTNFITYWLYTNGGSPKWVQVGDASLADKGSTLLPPCAGYFVHPKSGTINLTFAGRVRANDFACPLNGSLMIGCGWPLDQSPAERLMTTATNGFLQTGSPTTADKISLWHGDVVADSNAYDSWSYLTVSGSGRWASLGNASLTDQSSVKLFKSFHAAFIRVATPKPAYTIPLPWVP